MKHEDDLSGKEFGHWIVLELANDKTPKGKKEYFCKCRCCDGLYIIREDNLKTGRSTKCACCGLGWKNHRRKVVFDDE